MVFEFLDVDVGVDFLMKMWIKEGECVSWL